MAARMALLQRREQGSRAQHVSHGIQLDDQDAFVDRGVVAARLTPDLRLLVETARDTAAIVAAVGMDQHNYAICSADGGCPGQPRSSVQVPRPTRASSSTRRPSPMRLQSK